MPIRVTMNPDRYIQENENLSNILDKPLEEIPTIEYEFLEFELPLENTGPKPPALLFCCGNGKYGDPSWGVRAVDSSFVQFGNLQADYLIFGIGVHVVIHPAFVTKGKCDGYPAIADFTAAWRIVHEILDNYRISLNYMQRFNFLDEVLRDVAFVRYGPAKDRTPEDENAIAPTPTDEGEIGVLPYVQRLNNLLEARHVIDPFEPSETSARLIDVEHRLDRTVPLFRRLPKAMIFEKGIPFALSLQLRPGSTDWTEHARVMKPMINGERQIIIPAGAFSMRFLVKGYEICGEWRTRLVKEAEIKGSRIWDPGAATLSRR